MMKSGNAAYVHLQALTMHHQCFKVNSPSFDSQVLLAALQPVQLH